MTRGYRNWFQDLINVWTMPATMLKNKVMYRQFFSQCRFCKLKMLYMFKTFFLTFRIRLVFDVKETSGMPKVLSRLVRVLRCSPLLE